MDKLKPCPFCGGEAELEDGLDDSTRCTEKQLKAKAAEAWNRRVDDEKA